MFFILNKISFPTKSLVQKLNWWRQLIYGESDLFHVGRILMIAFQCNSNVLRKKIICLACTFVFCGNFDNSHYKPSLKRFRFFPWLCQNFTISYKKQIWFYMLSLWIVINEISKNYTSTIFFSISGRKNFENNFRGRAAELHRITNLKICVL